MLQTETDELNALIQGEVRDRHTFPTELNLTFDISDGCTLTRPERMCVSACVNTRTHTHTHA